jgi:hypothetical protein
LGAPGSPWLMAAPLQSLSCIHVDLSFGLCVSNISLSLSLSLSLSCSLSLSHTHTCSYCETQAGFKLSILLPQLPKCLTFIFLSCNVLITWIHTNTLLVNLLHNWDTFLYFNVRFYYVYGVYIYIYI